MKRTMRASVTGVIFAAATAALAAQQTGTVRVTAARANIRADASDMGLIVTQVTGGTVLTLLSIEGDWFHVQLPADARLGGARVEGYISNRVAKLESPPVPKPATPPPGAATRPATSSSASGAKSATPAPAVPGLRDGMSVALSAGEGTTWMTPRSLRVVRIADRVESLEALAASMSSVPLTSPPATGASPVTFVWLADGPAASQAIDNPRPEFVVLYKEIPGVGPDDLAPVIVKLSPISDARLVGALRGRADQASREDADWDVARDFRQDVMLSETRMTSRGAARIKPSQDLRPGEYAVVLRLTTRKKLPGASLLGPDEEGRVFGVAWAFSIK